MHSPVRSSWFFVSLVLPLLALLFLQAQMEEVVELHADGSMQRRYQVDEEGRKQGLFEQFFVDGSLEIRANYANDVLDGKYESFHEGGGKRVVATYSKGRKHGRRSEFAESRVHESLQKGFVGPLGREMCA